MTTRSPRFLALFALSALTMVGTYACSDDKDDPPGRILPDGGAEDDGGGGTGGRPSTGQSRIGRACVRDVDCGGQGLTCMTPASSELGGGGPPGGYCVADCTEGGNEACAELDPNSVCVRFSTSATTPGPAYCLEGCSVGTPAATASKCHDRLDVACDDTGGVSPGDGFCRPTCRGDYDCGARRCDLGSGFCVDSDEVTGTLPIGAPCDPSAAVEACNGVCIPLAEGDDAPGMCGALCSFGSPGCGVDPAEDLPNVACLFPLTDADPGLGDLGLCGSLCNCDDECPAFGRVCRPWPTQEDVDASGFKGYCGGAVDQNGDPTEHIACSGKPDGGAGDGGTEGGTPIPPDGGGPAPVNDASTD